jgi:hypothetical protein
VLRFSKAGILHLSGVHVFKRQDCWCVGAVASRLDDGDFRFTHGMGHCCIALCGIYWDGELLVGRWKDNAKLHWLLDVLL